MSERSAVRLVNHNRAWTFRKSLMAWPIIDKPFRQPIAFYTIGVAAGLLALWTPLALLLWSRGFGIIGTGLTLMPLWYAFRWINGRETTGAGVLPTASMWAGTAGAWLTAVVKPRRTTFRVRSRARRARVQPTLRARLGAAVLYARTLI